MNAVTVSVPNPQQLGAIGLVALFELAAKGNPTKAVAIANGFNKAAAVIAEIESADPAAITDAITQATANLDPALGLAFGNLLLANAGLVAQLEKIEQGTVVGEVTMTWLNNIATGFQLGAAKELAKWTPLLPPAPSATATTGQTAPPAPAK
jgi:hypothetical protein